MHERGGFVHIEGHLAVIIALPGEAVTTASGAKLHIADDYLAVWLGDPEAYQPCLMLAPVASCQPAPIPVIS